MAPSAVVRDSCLSCARCAGGETVAAVDAEASKLEAGESVEATFVQIAERVRGHGSELVVRKRGNGPPGKELAQRPVVGRVAKRAPHRARLPRPHDAKGRVEAEEWQGRDESD